MSNNSPTCSFELDIPAFVCAYTETKFTYLRVDAWLSPGYPATRWEPGEPPHAEDLRCYNEHGTEVSDDIPAKLWQWLEVQALAQAPTEKEDYSDY